MIDEQVSSRKFERRHETKQNKTSASVSPQGECTDTVSNMGRSIWKYDSRREERHQDEMDREDEVLYSRN